MIAVLPKLVLLSFGACALMFAFVVIENLTDGYRHSLADYAVSVLALVICIGVLGFIAIAWTIV